MRGRRKVFRLFSFRLDGEGRLGTDKCSGARCLSENFSVGYVGEARGTWDSLWGRWRCSFRFKYPDLFDRKELDRDRDLEYQIITKSISLSLVPHILKPAQYL